MSARLLLLRHGQIKANRLRRWHGSTDSPLTWRGRRQAKRTARHLQSRFTINAVYSSPLIRCQHTAQLAMSGQSHEIQTHPGLAEMAIGEWEDMLFRDLREQHDFINRACADTTFAPPGGESLDQVAARVVDALMQIDASHTSGQTILVATHGVAIGVALSMLLHEKPNRWIDYHIENCSLTEISLSPEPVVHAYNQHAHI